MKRDEIICITQQCGFGGQARVTNVKRLEQFAARVAAAEREACAKVVETSRVASNWNTREALAATIRAKGNE